jgi:uncharacterized protein YcfL
MRLCREGGQMRRFSLVLVLVGVLMATGCASITGYPSRSTNTKDDMSALAIYNKSEVIAFYNASSNSVRNGKTQKDYRNEVVNGRLAAIDIQYNLYQQSLYEEGIGTNILTDWVVIGLGGATTVVGGAATKAALGAAITGITGAKVSIDKNAYFDKTLPALVAKMQATRKEVLVRLRTGLNKDVDVYPLTQALVDLEDYYNAGTIPGAIAGVTASANADGKKADEELKVVLEVTRDRTFLDKSNTARVDMICNKIQSLGKEEVITLNQTPPTQDPDGEKTVRDDDKQNQRFVDENAARKALIVRARYDKRSEENLSAWEKALKLR